MAAMKAMKAIKALLLSGVYAVSLSAQNAAPVVTPPVVAPVVTPVVAPVVAPAAPQGLLQSANESTKTQPNPPQDRLPNGSALRYHVKMRMRGEDAIMETNFLLMPTPARRSNNKVQKPRFGDWRLEADPAVGTPFAQTMLLARAERLMYLSGPVPLLRPEPYGLRFGEKTYRVWKVPVPANVQGFASLLEVGKNTFVLCNAAMKFDTGEVATLEVHLEAFNLESGMAPPADGTALLSTLQQWSKAPHEGAGRLDDGITETQNVD